MSRATRNCHIALCAAALAVTTSYLAASQIPPNFPDTFEWVSVPVSGAAPSARSGHRMVYDSGRHKVVLFGGRDDAGALLNDVWEFDTALATWTDASPASGRPAPRANFGMAYDAHTGKVIVFGGQVDATDSPSGISGDTWEWDGLAWTQHALASSIVDGGLWGAELAYDAYLQQVILFGGESSPVEQNARTYAWNGADWQVVSESGPSGRVGHAMSSNPQTTVVTLFGGNSNVQGELTDTWEWNGTEWFNRTPAAGAHPAVTSWTAMAFDDERSVQVLFGGVGSNETWEWDGVSWTARIAAIAPSARATAMAYDTLQGRLVIFGGSDGATALGDSWIGSWIAPVVADTTTTITSASPPSSTYGQAVTLTAVVENTSGSDTPTGTVEFFDNGVSLGGPAPLVNGTASFLTSSISVNNQLTATYHPTGLFASSTSPVFPYTVTKASTMSTLTVSPTARQYSDLVTFEATVTTVNGQPPAESVTFKVGTQVMGTAPLIVMGTVAKGTLSNVPLLEPTPWGTPPTGQMKPAPLGRAVTATFNNVNPNFTVNSPAPKNLTITKEDARASYTGTLLATTASATSATTTVTLSATIKDVTATSDAGTDTNAGDIRHATVTFINRETGAAISPAIAVTLSDPSETRVGQVSYNWPVTVTGNAQTFRVGVKVDNYYLRDNSAEDALVTVAKGITTRFATGGGYLTMLTSGGLKPSTPGSLNHFGFGVTWSGTGSNPSGHFNTMTRSAGAVYSIKSTSFTSLSVSGKKATLRGTASIYSVTTGSTLVDSAATFEVTMTDVSESGTGDTIGITIKNSAGVVWFSSNFGGAVTLEQMLTAGDIKLP